MPLTQEHKQFQFKTVKDAGDGTPTAEELALINSEYALRELKTEEVYVRRMFLAHNAIDRDGDVFSDGLLDEFAKTLPGKGVFVKHPGSWQGDGGPGVGTFLQAEVVSMSTAEAIKLLGPLEFLPTTKEARLLKASYYIPRIDGPTNELITKIDTGVVRFVSIGFNADHRQPFEEEGGKFLASVIHGPGEALEGSFVWLGAQPGARNAKALGNQGEENMDTKELETKVSKLETDLKAATDLATENAKAATSLKALTDALGAELIENPTALKAAVEAGNQYRKSLVDGVIEAKRLLEMMGDDADEKAAAETFYKSMPLAMLEKEAKALKGKAPQGGSIDGGDPNTTGAADPEDGKQADGDVGDARMAIAHK